MMPTGQGKRKTWSPRDRIQLLAMKEEGKSHKEMAAYFGVTPRAIIQRFARLRNPEHKLKVGDSSRPGLKGVWRPKPNGSLRGGERWNEEENEKLLLLGDHTDNFSQASAALNRSPYACKVQFYALKRGAAAAIGGSVPIVKTKRERMDDRLKVTRASQTEYQSLGAALLGDPRPGRSALDQKLAEDNHPLAAHDRRYSDYRPPVTLATEPLR